MGRWAFEIERGWVWLPLARKKRESRDAARVYVVEGGRKKVVGEGGGGDCDVSGLSVVEGGLGREGVRGSAARGSEHGAIPGAALNESAFLCPAMLSKCKQRPIIYHPLRKQPPVNCHPKATAPPWSTPGTSSPTVCTRGYRVACWNFKFKGIVLEIAIKGYVNVFECRMIWIWRIWKEEFFIYNVSPQGLHNFTDLQKKMDCDCR